MEATPTGRTTLSGSPAKFTYPPNAEYALGEDGILLMANPNRPNFGAGGVAFLKTTLPAPSEVTIATGGLVATLPEDYLLSRDVSFAFTHAGTGETRIGRVDTEILGINAAISNLRIAGTTDLAWNRATRTLTVVGGGNGIIIYARLQ